jgi:glucose-1-phosphate cytidylyltransferase
MKVVLLAGGLGTRMREETEYRPKPMVEIGGRPVLWHLMKIFAHSGLTEFVVATGYKSDLIKDYFLNYEGRNNDFTVTLGNHGIEFHGGHDETDWRVTVAYTGELTPTGGRVRKVQRYLEPGGPFLCTYGDGLANVDARDLLEYHRSHGKLATVTTVRPPSRFGVLDLADGGRVERFREKPVADGWINVGFFVFEPEVLDYLSDDCTLEVEPLAQLAAEGHLMAYRHTGFWQPMDTFREWQVLNALWDSGEAPWRVW